MIACLRFLCNFLMTIDHGDDNFRIGDVDLPVGTYGKSSYMVGD
jgi:hypothetical protein